MALAHSHEHHDEMRRRIAGCRVRLRRSRAARQTDAQGEADNCAELRRAEEVVAWGDVSTSPATVAGERASILGADGDEDKGAGR